MTALLLMDAPEVQQDPDRWRQLRRGGITASEVAAMLGVCNPEHGSPFALYCAKTDPEAEDVGDSDALTRGRHLEPYVLERFAGIRPELELHPGGLWCSSGRSWQMATFDALAVDTGRLQPSLQPLRHFLELSTVDPTVVYPVEIKTSATYHGWGEPGTDQIPDAYRAQALAQMDVWDAEIVLIPVLFMVPWKVRVYAIRRNADTDADIAMIRAECERFLNRIADHDPPEVDWTPATTAALKTIMPRRPEVTVHVPPNAARKYAAAFRRVRQDKERHRLAANELLALSGGASRIVTTSHGEEVEVASRRAFNRTDVDLKLLREKYPHIAKECEVETPVDAIWPGKWTKGE